LNLVREKMENKEKRASLVEVQDLSGVSGVSGVRLESTRSPARKCREATQSKIERDIDRRPHLSTLIMPSLVRCG
jgi:hypothetical protein